MNDFQKDFAVGLTARAFLVLLNARPLKTKGSSFKAEVIRVPASLKEVCDMLGYVASKISVADAHAALAVPEKHLDTIVRASVETEGSDRVLYVTMTKYA